MKTRQKALLITLCLQTFLSSGPEEIKAFSLCLRNNKSTWDRLPNNIKSYIVWAITDNPTGTEMYRIGLKEQLTKVANYKEHLSQSDYNQGKVFWSEVGVLFTTLQLNRLEQRLNIHNIEYLRRLPSIQARNTDELKKKFDALLKREETYENWSYKLEENLKKAAQQCCKLLKENQKTEAKTAMLGYALLLNKLSPVEKLPSNQASIYAAAFGVLRFSPPSEWMNMSAYKAGKIVNTLIIDCFTLRGKGWLGKFSSTEILKQIHNNQMDKAITTTIKTIKDLAKKLKPSSLLANTKEKAAPSRHSKTSSTKKISPSPHKSPTRIVTLEEIGSTPLEKFAGH